MNITKVVIKFLPDTVVTQTAYGGLVTYPIGANFLQCTSTENYDSRLTHVKVMSEDKVWALLRHRVV